MNNTVALQWDLVRLMEIDGGSELERQRPSLVGGRGRETSFNETGREEKGARRTTTLSSGLSVWGVL